MHSDTTHPAEAFLRSIDIQELLPQQEPFVMVGNLIAFSLNEEGGITATETTINEDNLFAEDGHLAEAGLIENIAQTCAARIGYVNKYILKKGIQIGVIGAIRNLTIYQLPKLGDAIITTTRIKEEIFGMTLATAEVREKGTLGRVLLTTEMKIAVRDERIEGE